MVGRYGFSDLLLAVAAVLFLIAGLLAVGAFTGGNQAALVDFGLVFLAAGLIVPRRP